MLDAIPAGDGARFWMFGIARNLHLKGHRKRRVGDTLVERLAGELRVAEPTTRRLLSDHIHIALDAGLAARSDLRSRGPLASRLRPSSLDDVVGQDHLLGARGALRALVEARKLTSVILWGPAGAGKATIAHLLALADPSAPSSSPSAPADQPWAR